MTDWALQQPLWLLLWPAGLLIAWLWRQRLRWLTAAQVFGLQVTWRHPALAGAGLSPSRRRVAWPRVIALACVSAALAQPVRLGDPLPAARPAVDLHVLLDTSVSVVLTDYRQDGRPVQRLTFAKGLLNRLAAEFGGDRLSLYLVGSPSRRLLAPTPDHQLFRNVLARVEPVLAGRRAEPGDAMARLADDLKHRSTGRTALALLVTDGTQPSGQLTPQAGAARLAEQGVPLYVLAIGSGASAQVANSGLLFDSARPDRLTDLAQQTGGTGFAAADVRALQAAMDTLTARHLANAPPPPARREPFYHWLLLAALAVLALPTAVGRAKGAS